MWSCAVSQVLSVALHIYYISKMVGLANCSLCSFWRCPVLRKSISTGWWQTIVILMTIIIITTIKFNAPHGNPLRAPKSIHCHGLNSLEVMHTSKIRKVRIAMKNCELRQNMRSTNMPHTHKHTYTHTRTHTQTFARLNQVSTTKPKQSPNCNCQCLIANVSAFNVKNPDQQFKSSNVPTMTAATSEINTSHKVPKVPGKILLKFCASGKVFVAERFGCARETWRGLVPAVLSGIFFKRAQNGIV